ncbi:MAG: hypothetical protein HY600_00265, partial [Candidatus Omnitrophica bacterium]|nr:hypothetical protein [Candidatus Omnitrophota bacterium]
MTRSLLGLIGIILVVGVGLAVARGLRPRPAPAFVPGEALVQFHSTVSDQRAGELIAQAGAVTKQRIDPQRIYVVTSPSPLTAPQLVERFRQMAEVAHAELNGIYTPSGEGWFAPAEAWAEEPRAPLGAGAPVKIAVIDTAIDATHPALAGKVVQGYNFTTNTTST